MKIKEIELNGFKSFGDRTIIQLHDGVTCIVGPNGCGKSNVVDAFRWVLGEQSAKSLRGEKMEEVIFQGSANKKPKGMAEVRLTLSHSVRIRRPEGEAGPVQEDPGDKMIVARRLFRSGDSEYLMNNRECRLKDIKDVFLDTGLDVKSYSILDQGRIGEILNAKPLDRRFLIEEVAGVMKYKVRRAEALSKLESSKENLLRISDIVGEVKRQINSLDRLVKKAERYKRLLDEHKQVDLRVAKRTYIRLRETLDALQTAIGRMNEALAARRSEYAGLENEIATKRIELLEKEKAITELEVLLAEKSRRIAELEKSAAVLRNVAESKQADIGRLHAQIGELDAKRESLTLKLAELDGAEKSATETMDNVTESLREKKDWAVRIEAAIEEKERELEGKRKELFSLSDALGNRRNDLQKLHSSLETLAYRETTALRDKGSIADRQVEMENALAEIGTGIEERKAELDRLRAERDRMGLEIDELRGMVESKRHELSGEKEALAANLSRLSSLKELIIDKSLVEFIAESGELTHRTTTILSQVISADKDYEAAIEAALSERVNALLLDRAEDILATVALIREKDLGKTALLFTEFCKGGQENVAAPAGEGMLGKASDFITVEPGLAEGIAATLLRNVFVTRDLQSALNLRRQGICSGATIVTLSGEVITAEGFVVAGKGKDILKRQREIKELQREIAGRQNAIAEIEQSISALSDDLNYKKEELRVTDGSIVAHEKELSLAKQSRETKNEELERMKRKLAFIESELSALAQDRESLQALISSKTEEVSGLDADRTSLSDLIMSLQEGLAGVRGEYETERAHLSELKTTLAAYREKLDALRKERETVTETVAEVEAKKVSSVEEIASAEEKIAVSQDEIAQLDEQIKALVIEAKGIEEDRGARREAISSENQDLVGKDETLKGFRTAIEAQALELADHNTHLAENRVRLETVEASMQEKYAVTIAAEEVDFEGSDPEADDRRVAELNEQLVAMGPVNLGTIEEYEELKTRYDFLTKQQLDLTQSIAELEEAISRINTTTRRKLREAYDALRTKFVEVFSTLFGGGRADIILTDEENILESGLDIIAQPPGKKLQNIMLLSGGEKALTSLALLFAGFLIKPSPMCILDEADAPLDESNTVRFAQMIKSLSIETQFLIITHNRATMEAADYLYGITMEEPGVSKAISLRFSEAEAIVATA